MWAVRASPTDGRAAAQRASRGPGSELGWQSQTPPALPSTPQPGPCPPPRAWELHPRCPLGPGEEARPRGPREPSSHTPPVCLPPAWPRILPSQNPATPQVRPAQGQGLGTASRAGDATGCCSSKKLPAAPCWLDERKGVHSAPPDSHSMDRDQKAGARISALQGPPFLIC